MNHQGTATGEGEPTHAMKSKCVTVLGSQGLCTSRCWGGRGQGMSLADTRDQPHGMCVEQTWAGRATHS